MYVKRNIEELIQKLAAQFPVITINGPRQSGKTTLAKKLFPDKPYINIEIPDLKEAISDDPRKFLLKYAKTGAIIDEIQKIPKLLSYIQNDVDVIFRTHGNLIPIEIKSSYTFNSNFLHNLNYYKKLVFPKANVQHLVYSGVEEFEIKDAKIINFKNIAEAIRLL